MPVLLQIKDICKKYGANVILENATASFSSDQKIGVIGRNGAGKSTLCRIITGHEKQDSGEITPNSLMRMSYLEQHDDFQPGETVSDFLMRKSGKEHWECGEAAARFHINFEILERPIQSLPGGYQTRVKLTTMILGDPNFLIMDEPSNYLDLATLILLENFLLDFRGGYLIVSHDREFLKRTCDHTLEVEAGKCTLYPGDVEEYFEFKEEQVAQKEAYNRGIEKKRDQLQAFVDRFKARASTATRAASKVKQIAKLKTIEIGHEASTVRMNIPEVERKAGIALVCEDVAIGYPDKDIAKGINLEIERGHHVAVLGNNGEGKTTFLRTIANTLPIKSGNVRWGTGLKTAYYAQHVFATLNPADDVLSYLNREAADGVGLQEVLNMAGCFLFKGDDTKKLVRVLSGGERARLVLAGMLLSKSHVMLMDEPTNHLDFETVEALAHALKGFGGTVIFISHDRTFVNLIATHILEVKSGRIKRYPGKYEDYVYHLESVARGEEEDDDAEHQPSGKGNQTASAAKPQASPKDTAQTEKAEMKKLKKAMEDEEKTTKNLTAERDKLFQEMANNPFMHSKEHNTRLKELEGRIKESEENWFTLQAKLEKLKP